MKERNILTAAAVDGGFNHQAFMGNCRQECGGIGNGTVLTVVKDTVDVSEYGIGENTGKGPVIFIIKILLIRITKK